MRNAPAAGLSSAAEPAGSVGLSRSFGLHDQVEDPELPEWLKEIPESRRIRTSNKIVFWSSPPACVSVKYWRRMHDFQDVMIVRAFC